MTHASSLDRISVLDKILMWDVGRNEIDGN